MGNLEALVEKKKRTKTRIRQRHFENQILPQSRVELEITIALKHVKRRTSKKNLLVQDKKEAKKKAIKEYGRIETLYHVLLPQSVYQSADYNQLYAHMGNARLPRTHFISFTKEEKSAVIVEEYKGELTGLEAESVVHRVMYMQLFGTSDEISIDERERFAHWRLFNHEMRRFYEATAAVRYKPLMGMKLPVLAK